VHYGWPEPSPGGSLLWGTVCPASYGSHGQRRVRFQHPLAKIPGSGFHTGLAEMVCVKAESFNATTLLWSRSTTARYLGNGACPVAVFFACLSQQQPGRGVLRLHGPEPQPNARDGSMLPWLMSNCVLEPCPFPRSAATAARPVQRRSLDLIRKASGVPASDSGRGCLGTLVTGNSTPRPNQAGSATLAASRFSASVCFPQTRHNRPRCNCASVSSRGFLSKPL
jgi:hypothetical protein